MAAPAPPAPRRAAIVPMPPVAPGRLPWIGSGRRLLRDPTGFFAETRRRLGDTYVVDAFGRRLFCVFSAAGVKALYALPEQQASFGAATYNLLRLKIPSELFQGRRNTPRTLFGNPEVERYLHALDDAVAAQMDELGDGGTFEVFAGMRRLGHRLGFASWIGSVAVSARWLDRLIPLFDRIDSADAFVRPAQAFRTAVTGHRRERRAMHAIEALVAAIRVEARVEPDPDGDFLARLYASYGDLPEPARDPAVARDVIMLHLGSQSNLYAALAWTFVNVVTRPDVVACIRGGDDGLLEQCANESIRIQQRSITLRQVLQPIALADERRTYRIEPGVLIATMLSVNNTTAAPGLERFDPAHYDGRRLAATVPLAARELVSTFGHGSHSCPAQRFAISAIRTAVRRLVARYDFVPHFVDTTPRVRQLGAVARAAHPCVVAYRLRDDG
jgi:cytochrome P450